MIMNYNVISLYIMSTVAVIVLFSGGTSAFQSELSALIEAGRRECFHQYFIQGLTIEIDYQVIQGGDHDISLTISSPTNRVIMAEMRKSTGQHKFQTDEKGEYHFCFDNSHSRFAFKQVFFFIGSNEEFEDPSFKINSILDNPAHLNYDQLGELEDKLEKFRTSFTSVIRNLELAQRLQHILRSFDLIDSLKMENSKERVDFWSIVNIICMITVGMVQVYMIRSLFEDKSKIGRVLRGGGSSNKMKSFT
jgi:p24 family protein gamma-2